MEPIPVFQKNVDQNGSRVVGYACIDWARARGMYLGSTEPRDLSSATRNNHEFWQERRSTATKSMFLFGRLWKFGFSNNWFHSVDVLLVMSWRVGLSLLCSVRTRNGLSHRAFMRQGYYTSFWFIWILSFQGKTWDVSTIQQYAINMHGTIQWISPKGNKLD